MVAIVRAAIPALSLLLCSGCLGLTLDPADNGASAATASSSRADAGGDAATSTGGTGCVVDSVSNVMLCTSVDACPGLAVDHDLYPDCGFRVPALSIDVLCVCGDSLCSLGTALSCPQIQAMLAQSSELAVCAQENEGRCAARGPVKPTPSGSCDHTCASECAGDPGCFRLCGC
jgi:hypothetical protein